MSKPDGGPARCTRGACTLNAVIKQGNQWLCAMHYRFGQMRHKAKQRGKAVPSYNELHAMVQPGNRCVDCGQRMNWRSVRNTARVASLQHYRDGTMALVCRSCNTRHAYMRDDSYRDMDKASKQCPQCLQIKPFSGFSVDRGRSGPMKLKSWCKRCSSIAHTEWQRNNRDHYNRKQREGRAARRVAG